MREPIVYVRLAVRLFASLGGGRERDIDQRGINDVEGHGHAIRDPNYIAH